MLFALGAGSQFLPTMPDEESDDITAKTTLNTREAAICVCVLVLWAGNVELLVLQKVGQTTVVYVSNIYKYYVAHKLVVEQGQSLQ